MLQDEKVLKISVQGRLVVYLVAAIYSLKKNYRFESHFCLREKCSRMTVDWKTKRPKNNKGRLVLMVAQLHNCHTVKESGDQIPLKIKNSDLKIKTIVPTTELIWQLKRTHFEGKWHNWFWQNYVPRIQCDQIWWNWRRLWQNLKFSGNYLRSF